MRQFIFNIQQVRDKDMPELLGYRMSKYEDCGYEHSAERRGQEKLIRPIGRQGCEQYRER